MNNIVQWLIATHPWTPRGRARGAGGGHPPYNTLHSARMGSVCPHHSVSSSSPSMFQTVRARRVSDDGRGGGQTPSGALSRWDWDWHSQIGILVIMFKPIYFNHPGFSFILQQNGIVQVYTAPATSPCRSNGDERGDTARRGAALDNRP